MTKWRITEITHYPGTKKESKSYLVEKRFLGFLWWHDPFDDGMYDDGYFHRGVERLSDEQARRNLDKTMMWLDKGIIPSFLKEDMQEYMKKYKQLQIQNQERLMIEC